MHPSSCLLLSLGITLTAQAADWPQWRGPNRDEHSTETGTQAQWPDAGPNRLWVNDDVGLGYAGFAVVGETLYTLAACRTWVHRFAN